MSQCQDFPCCGHERGCCPDYDESGQQMNMKCVCGAVLPITSRYSICDYCMNQDEETYDDANDYCNQNNYDYGDYGY